MRPASPTASLSKMTTKQAESLEAMRSCLVCQLCDKKMIEPATLLACAHSFCHGCILQYTENSWTCPLPGCGKPVTMRGGSRESIKKNHVISAVMSSLENIERIIATGPENWWVGRKEEGPKSPVQQSEDEEEVVDFQMIMDQDENEGKGEGSASEEDNDDDASSTTKEYYIDPEMKENKAPWSGRKATISLDQTLLLSGESPNFFDGNNIAAPPDFSCSPIPMQSSQPEFSPMPSISNRKDEDGRLIATASQLDRVRKTSAQKGNTKTAKGDTGLAIGRTGAQNNESTKRSTQKGNTKSAKSDTALPITEETSTKPNSSRKKRRTSTPTPSIQSSSQSKPRRATRVSFQQQPRVLLLDPSWNLSTTHARCLRKATDDGFLSVLQLRSDDVFSNADEFDSGFDFDVAENRESFLATLSSNRTIQQPPAPMSFYAVSCTKDEDFPFEEPIVVPRSFPYYLAVACGLPIVDIGFVSAATHRKRRGTMSHQRYPFPSQPGAGGRASDTKRDTKSSQKDHLVYGASNYSWGAPQKARAAALDRHSSWQMQKGPHASLETLLPGTDLLHGYVVLLLGEYDQPNHSRRTVAKRKKQRDSETKKGGGYCTHGNLSLLLQLCGAEVYDIDAVVSAKHVKRGLAEKHFEAIKNKTPMGASESGRRLMDVLQPDDRKSINNILVMVKDKSELKLGNEFLNQMNAALSAESDEILEISIVSSQWLLDSIGEFEVKDQSQYTALEG